MVEMWERLSLRTRLLLPLGLMFLAALIAGGVSLQIFATAQLMEETEPTARSARAVAAALILRHSWRADDLACILERLGMTNGRKSTLARPSPKTTRKRVNISS